MRSKHDFYATPPSAVRPLIDLGILPTDGPWLEPCAGNGAIIRAVPEVPEWWASELRQEECAGLDALVGRSVGGVACPLDLIRQQDVAREWVQTIEPSVIITNPPNKDAFTIVRLLREWSPNSWLAILQPVGFLGTLGRWGWFVSNEPDEYRLAARPDFQPGRRGGSGGIQEYSWFVWPPGLDGERRTRGERRILPPHGHEAGSQERLI